MNISFHTKFRLYLWHLVAPANLSSLPQSTQQLYHPLHGHLPEFHVFYVFSHWLCENSFLRCILSFLVSVMIAFKAFLAPGLELQSESDVLVQEFSLAVKTPASPAPSIWVHFPAPLPIPASCGCRPGKAAVTAPALEFLLPGFHSLSAPALHQPRRNRPVDERAGCLSVCLSPSPASQISK